MVFVYVIDGLEKYIFIRLFYLSEILHLFSYKKIFALPKQFPKSRSVLKTDLDFLRLFRKGVEYFIVEFIQLIVHTVKPTYVTSLK